MSKEQKRTEGEELERQERQATDWLKKNPAPAEVQVSASFERKEEQDYELDKAQEILSDVHSSGVVMRRLEALEEMFARQNAMLMSFLEKQGAQTPRQQEERQAEGKDPIIVPPSAPLDAVITIHIASGQTAAESEPIPVGINGNIRMIPRDVYTQVTRAELEVLQHAVIEKYEYPVANGIPLARKDSLEHMTLSRPVHSVRARFPMAVTPFEIPRNPQ